MTMIMKRKVLSPRLFVKACESNYLSSQIKYKLIAFFFSILIFAEFASLLSLMPILAIDHTEFSIETPDWET